MITDDFYFLKSRITLIFLGDGLIDTKELCNALRADDFQVVLSRRSGSLISDDDEKIDVGHNVISPLVAR